MARKSPQARGSGEGLTSKLPSAELDSKAAPDAELGKKNDQENWAEQADSEAYLQASKLYKLIAAEYDNKNDQDLRNAEYWNIYNAIPDANAQYTGNTQGYIPAVRDAINARTKRTLKLLFPANYKHVDGVSADANPPNTQLALLEYYIRKTNLRSIVRSDLIAGDVTGQWNLMIDWLKTRRTVTRLVKRNPVFELAGENGAPATDIELGEFGDDLGADEDTEREEIVEEGPDIVDFATEDLAVLPPTQNNLQKAQCVCVRLRLSAAEVKRLVDEGVLILPKDSDIDKFCQGTYSEREKRNPNKQQVNAAGIKTNGQERYALVYMAYTRLDFGGEVDESGIVYFTGINEIGGLIKNPLWSGKVPIMSAPVERLQGSFFGQSKIEPVKFLQWNLNDFWNMGQDSAMYSLLPIWSVDPLKCPNWSGLVMGLAAVWPVDPTGVKPITQPQLWKDSTMICDTMKRQIWESMDVNEMMMGAMPQGRKNNVMMGNFAQEQSTNITDHATRYEEAVLNPLLEFMFEFDQQFRTADLMIVQRGPIGVKAKMEPIAPQQWDARYFFRWTGTEYVQSMQLTQQKIAWMNVLKGVPPQQLGGLTLNVAPILVAATGDMFGPELAPQILKDERNMYTVAAHLEDEMLHNGFDVPTHEADNDEEHLRSHMRAATLNGDPVGLYKQHMGMHMLQSRKKREMQAQQQGGVPGGPGGEAPNGNDLPGVAGAPRPGAMPAPDGGRPMQQPPGSIPTDNMPGAMGRG